MMDLGDPIWDNFDPEVRARLEELAAGYEGVDMTSQWQGTKEERDALRRRGINPKNFNPRMQGAFKDFEFSGNFNQDLQGLYDIYQGTGNTGHNNRNPTSMSGMDYQRALDMLFQQHPDQQTQSGRHYLNVGVPYFRQGDNTGFQPGGQLGDFSTYHINDDTDAFGNFIGAVADSPIGTALDIALGAPPAFAPGNNLGPGFDDGGGYGGPAPSDIIGGIADLVGDGSTFDGAPDIPTGGFESIFGPNEGDLTGAGPIPGEPVMDVPGPGGMWDLINIDIPGGIPGEDVGPFPPGSGNGQGGGTGETGGGGETGQAEPLPENPGEGGQLPPWLEPEPGDPDYEPPPQTEPPAEPPQTEPPQNEEDQGGLPPLPPWLPDIETGSGDQDSTVLPPIDINLPDFPGGIGDSPVSDGNGGIDFGDWLPGTLGDIDWSNILNPDFDIRDLVGDIATSASVGDINIDFGDLATALAGAYAGYDQSRQDPQYPTMKDLYGGDFEEDMKGLRRGILNQEEADWLADLPPEMRQAIGEMTGYSDGLGRDVSGAQWRQGGLGMGGLEGMGSYADFLRSGGGPEFEYDQDVFDATMANLMPGIAGSYVDQTRDMVRNLNENLLPQIDLGASMTGNMASSRTGIESGLARRGTEDRMADVESQLIQNAISQAQGAAMGAGSATLGARMGTQGDILSGYSGSAQYGLPGYGEAFGTATDASRLGLAGGDILREYDQAVLDTPRDLMGWQIPLINATPLRV